MHFKTHSVRFNRMWQIFVTKRRIENDSPLVRFSREGLNHCISVKCGMQFVLDIYYIRSSTLRCEFLHFRSLKICEKILTLFCSQGSKQTFWEKSVH